MTEEERKELFKQYLDNKTFRIELNWIYEKVSHQAWEASFNMTIHDSVSISDANEYVKDKIADPQFYEMVEQLMKKMLPNDFELLDDDWCIMAEIFGRDKIYPSYKLVSMADLNDYLRACNAAE